MSDLKNYYSKIAGLVPKSITGILFLIIVFCIILYLIIGAWDTFFINLITEIAGIIVTVYIVLYILKKSEKKGTVVAEKKIQKDIRQHSEFFAKNIFYRLKSKLDIKEPVNGKDFGKMKSLIDENIERYIENCDQAELNSFKEEIEIHSNLFNTIMGTYPDYAKENEIFYETRNCYKEMIQSFSDFSSLQPVKNILIKDIKSIANKYEQLRSMNF